MLLKSIMNRFVETSLKGTVCPSKTKAQAGDKVVGVLSDDNKKLFLILDEIKCRSDALYAKHQARIEGCKDPNVDIPKAEQDQMIRERLLLSNEHKLAKTALWCSIYQQYPELLEIPGTATLLEGWQVMAQHPANTLCEGLNAFAKSLISSSADE